MVIGTGCERDPVEVRILAHSRRRALAEGKEAIKGCIESALDCTVADRKPLLRYIGASYPVGAWQGYSLQLVFVNALDGTSVVMNSNDKRISDALSVVNHTIGKRRLDRKRGLDAFGAEVNVRIVAKIKTLLLERERITPAAELARCRDICVACPIAGCPHSEGFLSVRLPAMTTTTCPNGHQTCLECLQPRHLGPCGAVAAFDFGPVTAADPTKICPRCRNAVSKIDGCNHMECRCGQHFCWLCLTTFDSTVRWLPHNSPDGVCHVGLGVFGAPDAGLWAAGAPGEGDWTDGESDDGW